MRVGETDAVEAVLQPREVLRQPERPSLVHGNELVDAVAEDEPAIEDGDLRFLERKKLRR